MSATQYRRALPGSQGDQHRPPDHFLDEGGGDAFGARRHLAEVGVHGQVTRVYPEQPFPALHVGAGNLHRQVNPAGPVSQGGRLVDELDGQAGQQDDGAAGQASRQVADGVRLTRPRRPVQEQAALEMLPRAEQFPRPLRDTDDVLFDMVKHSVGQDHILRRDHLPGQEGKQLVAVARPNITTSVFSSGPTAAVP